jgi:hypothetical protein
VWWITSTLDTRMKDTASRLTLLSNGYRAHASKLAALDIAVREHASTALKAELADLIAAVDADRARSRKEFGKLWAKSANGREPVVLEGEIDHELQAMLDLQRAAPAQPK